MELPLSRHEWDILANSDDAREAGDLEGEAYWIGYYDGMKGNVFDLEIEPEDRDAYKQGHQDGINAKQENWEGREEEVDADAATQSLTQEC
jgi:hypothetical protein